MVAEIEADLGGREQLSAIERGLIEGFAGASIILQGINFKIAVGEVIAVADLAQAISSMVRVAARLGEQRRLRVVNGRQHQNGSPLRSDLSVDAEPLA
jgi:hypothetical protein